MWAMRAGLLGCIAILFVSDASASGDSVTTRVNQLTNGSAFKVRLSAAVSLGKSSDPRAVIGLAYAVRNDDSSTVRRVAVAGIARIVTRNSMGEETVEEAIAAIDDAVKDKDKKVRKTAKKARKMISKMRDKEDEVAAAKNTGAMFVAVGDPSDPQKHINSGTRTKMNTRLKSAIQRKAPDYEIGSMDDALSKSRAYYVGATVSNVWTTASGSQTEVRCKVTIRVSPLKEGREHFIAGESASANGTGRVVGPSSNRAVRDSTTECVLAVVEQVAERQVVPFIQKIAKSN